MLLDVATGVVLQERPGVREPGRPLASPFGGVEEIEPIEGPRRSLLQSDALADYR